MPVVKHPLWFIMLACALVACAGEPPTQAQSPAITYLPSASPTAGATTLVETATPQPTLIPTLTPPPPTFTPSPTALREPSPTPVPETVVILTGDINPARCVYQFAKDANDMALPYRAIAPILQAADIAVGSLDASISDINPPTPCIETTRNLLAPSAVVSGLAYAGFDVITVATNHIKDCGLIRGCVHESMLDSMWHLAEAGIQPVGAGRTLSEAAQPVIVTVNGTRFAFLGFTAINGMTWAEADRPGTLPAQMAIVIPAIEAAKAQADVVIVLPQWGREFRREISFEQWEWAQEMVEAGAMLIVGNNPHRVQGVETFPNGAVVAYALGNFVFDQQWSDGTQYTVQGMMVKATFRGTQLANVELIPIHIYDNFQPRLAPPDEAAAILQDVVTSMATAPRR